MTRTLLAFVSLSAFALLPACGGYQRAQAPGSEPRERYERPEGSLQPTREVREDHFDDTEGMEDNGLLPGDDNYEPAEPYNPDGPDAQPEDWDGSPLDDE